MPYPYGMLYSGYVPDDALVPMGMSFASTLGSTAGRHAANYLASVGAPPTSYRVSRGRRRRLRETLDAYRRGRDASAGAAGGGGGFVGRGLRALAGFGDPTPPLSKAAIKSTFGPGSREWRRSARDYRRRARLSRYARWAPARRTRAVERFRSARRRGYYM